MKINAFSKNLLLVVFSRAISLISSVAIAFLIPKFLSITDYGYYKVFTLYTAYTALLHFGFVDGILIKLSGKLYDELDFEKMRAYTSFFIFFEIVIAFFMIIICLLFLDEDYLFIGLMLAVNMIFVNITTYYQFISQAVQFFKEYSIKNVISSIAKFIIVISIFIIYLVNKAEISYKFYLLILNIIEFVMLIWYIKIYSKITFGKRKSFKSIKNEILEIFKTGIMITLSYQISHLILVLDRQFVNVLFSTETFAIYSFAYNVVSMVSTMISSIAVVLLPMLKQSNEEKLIKFYKKGVIAVSIISACSLLAYFPLIPFINWFLPNYTESLRYIAIVLPTFLFTAVITVVMFTMAKVLNMNFDFFKVGCVILMLGFITNIIAYLVFKSPQAISYASLIVMIIWFIAFGLKLKRKLDIGICKELCYLILILLGFIITTAFMQKNIISIIVFIIWLCLCTIIFYYKFLVIELTKMKVGDEKINK